MNIYMVSFELADPEHTGPGLRERLHGHHFARLNHLSYLVASEGSADALFRELQAVMTPADRLYVAAVHAPWQGHGLPRVMDWMEERLG